MLIYDDALAPGWESWSWSGDYDLAATDDVHAGAAAISAHADAFGALSLHDSTSFSAHTLHFWFVGDAISLMLEADGEGYSSTALAVPAAATWTELSLDLDPLGAHAWTRVDFFADGAAARFHVDDIELRNDTPSGYTAAEPLGTRTLLLYGSGDPTTLGLAIDGTPATLTASTELSDPPRLLTTWSADLHGTLTITTATQSWTRVLTPTSVSIDAPDHPISPLIYGMAFPNDAAYIADHGVSVARWGGNAVTLHNPDLDVTNLAFDWYFENYTADDETAWLDDMTAAGAATFFTLPALDYVAKDDSACGYSITKYGAQTDHDPWRTDCGSGTLADGSDITWNDPSDHGTPWSPELAGDFLATVSPTYVAIDNEMDIASDTHRDVHPDPVTYDELAERWLSYADVVREVLPTAQIAGPSSCCWWFYWNSEEGSTDKAAHGDVDFLPWWLDQIAAHDAATGVRTLDLFDVHYYPDDEFNDDVDAETAARRLRSTRGLWDPSYTDEGWIGADVWATQSQPNPQQVQLIPRMQALLDEHYPGTKFGLTEWNWGAESDMSGGLAVADVLGILGREDVDVATYWTAPAAGTPAAAAFQLYKGFGTESRPVTFDNPDLLGVYAADDGDALTVIVVNKDPDHDLILGGTYTVTHFGPHTGGAVLDEGTVEGVVVPAYSAVLLRQASIDDTGNPDDTGTPDDTDGGPSKAGDDDGSPACGCASTPPSALWLLVPLLRRRRAG